MIMPEIKICGMKTLEDIENINHYPVNYVGFIFAENSKRKVSVEQAAEMRRRLRSDIKAVGIFTYKNIYEINKIADKVGIDILQLHSDETDDDCQKALKKVWKMISVKDEKFFEKMIKYPNAEGFLLDTQSYSLGGSGKTFNWEFAKGVSQRYFTILAGGINPQNALEAINKVKPHVLDVNSGVETDGKKDIRKIDELFGRIGYVIR